MFGLVVYALLALAAMIIALGGAALYEENKAKDLESIWDIRIAFVFAIAALIFAGRAGYILAVYG